MKIIKIIKMSNGDKRFIFKSKSIKQLNLIKKKSPFDEIKEINKQKENNLKFSIDYHLKNENLLSNSLINKRLSKHSSYRKNNKSII